MSDDWGGGCVAGNEGCCGLWVLAWALAGAVVTVFGILLGQPRKKR